MEGINSGDTAWVIVSTALVLLMTVGLAFFYGGLVRRKNVLSIIMQCFMILGVVSIQWVLFGYSLAFGPDHGGVIGDFSFAAMHGVGMEPSPDYATTVPHILFVMFQMMFAVITPALIIGAFAERMKFSAFLVFSLLWVTLVYDPMAHWVWGGGWLADLGVLDFAGGIVVHINAGMAALAAVLVIGKRRGYPDTSPPHNLPFAVLGAGLLWFGWFGFNGGSALAANGLAASALMTTHLGGATAAVTWAVLEWILRKKPTALGIISGAIAGLAAVTPAAGFVGYMGAMGIGALSAVVCYFAVVVVKNKLGYDDSLDAFGVHGIGGVAGVLLTGFWALSSLTPDGVGGVFQGSGSHLVTQLVGVAACGAFSFAASWVLLKVIDKTMGLRVQEDHENIGLDLTQHRESAYTIVG